MRLIYTKEALGDLKRLRAFIAEKNPSAARKTGEDLAKRIEGLRTFPKMGWEVDRAANPARTGTSTIPSGPLV